MEIEKLKKRLKDLKKQEEDFDSEETKNKVSKLGLSRLIAEQDRLNILVSNRSEQKVIEEWIKDKEDKTEE